MPGTVVTEGDRAMQSDLARFNHSLDGSGIKIGIISDSFDNRGAVRKTGVEVAAGELPGDGNPNGYSTPVKVLKEGEGRFSSDIDEGRAMAQIIHDVAPGAELLFYSPSSVTDFANGIEALAAAGADIIVDDLRFSNQPFFQDGPVAQAVNRVTDRGVSYISAAGNFTPASYESPFRPSGEVFTVSGNFTLGERSFSLGNFIYEAHDFDPAPEVDLFQDMVTLLETQPIRQPRGFRLGMTLQWSEPFRSSNLGPGADTNLDLFLMAEPRLPESFIDPDLIAARFFDNEGNDPLEFLFLTRSVPFRSYLVIGQRRDRLRDTDQPSPDLIKWVDWSGSSIYEYVNDQAGRPIVGTIYGHPNAAGAIAVAAIDVRQTAAFDNNTLSPRFFTSWGGIPILFDDNGEPLESPIIRAKPELAAPDGVSTSVRDFEIFAGTSAAAPHLAAVAALVLQRAGGRRRLSPQRLRAILLSSTLDAGPFDGPDRATGQGFVQADRAVVNAVKTRLMPPGQTRLNGRAVSENLVGSDQDDRLLGQRGNDFLAGEAGDDTLEGNQGQDLLVGMQGNDRLQGNQGHDTLYGSSGQDQLDGGRGDDRLLGNRGNDSLVGGTGDDLLIGGAGRDRATGNSGRDRFGIEDEPGLLLITDFQVGEDQLTLLGDLKFRRLTFGASGDDTIVSLGSTQTLARIKGVQPNQISRADVVGFSLSN
ncbi:MAG: S8 family serine peptidase [Leptolyngbyaceae cyanobacterium]